MVEEGWSRRSIPVFNSVAAPIRFVYAPAHLAMIADGFTVVLSIFVMVATGGAGLILFSVVGVHVVMVMVGAREPQIDNLMRAWFEKPRPRRARVWQRRRHGKCKWVLSP